MCGEKFQYFVHVLFQIGSPPHVRGKAPPYGKITVRRWDHPRMCGEKFACFFVNAQTLRITPACAGKSP